LGAFTHEDEYDELPGLLVGLTLAAIPAVGSLVAEAEGGPRLEPVSVERVDAAPVRGGYLSQNGQAVYVATGHGILGIRNDRVRVVRIRRPPADPQPPDSIARVGEPQLPPRVNAAAPHPTTAGAAAPRQRQDDAHGRGRGVQPAVHRVPRRLCVRGVARPGAVAVRQFDTAKRMVRGHPELERRITPRYS
jgi:hypothetical protein